MHHIRHRAASAATTTMPHRRGQDHDDVTLSWSGLGLHGPPMLRVSGRLGFMSGERELTVAVTGPTGTFGFGLMPLLQADDRVARIVGIARRPFDPAGYGWTKLEYRRGDVRDPAALRGAFAGADV